MAVVIGDGDVRSRRAQSSDDILLGGADLDARDFLGSRFLHNRFSRYWRGYLCGRKLFQDYGGFALTRGPPS